MDHLRVPGQEVQALEADQRGDAAGDAGDAEPPRVRCAVPEHERVRPGGHLVRRGQRAARRERHDDAVLRAGTRGRRERGQCERRHGGADELLHRVSPSVVATWTPTRGGHTAWWSSASPAWSRLRWTRTRSSIRRLSGTYEALANMPRWSGRARRTRIVEPLLNFSRTLSEAMRRAYSRSVAVALLDRDAELAALAAELAKAREGDGRLVVVEG